MNGNGTPSSQSRRRGRRPLMEGLRGTGVFIDHKMWLSCIGGNLINP
jgi:hypothetical protein